MARHAARAALVTLARNPVRAGGVALLAIASFGGCTTLLGIHDPNVVGDDGGGLDAGNGGDDGAPPGPMQSCAPGGVGMTACGSSGESCCTSLRVDNGTYFRTYTPGGDGGGESDPATVSAFRLDKYEVTVGRFRQFVSAWNSGWTPPAGAGKHVHLNGGQGLADSASPGSFESGWKVADDGAVSLTASALQCASQFAWTVSPGANERLPMDCVNWYEAYAFCIWDGGFLPSEAEWEYAAAGGDAQQEYPWGGAPPGSANAYAIYGCYYPNGSGNCDAALPLAPVGTATSGAGRWGQLDLAGNVWEWALDWDNGYVDPCVDCAYVSGGSAKRYRGGSGYDAVARIVPTYRNGDSPSAKRDPSLGFRCARAPQ